MPDSPKRILIIDDEKDVCEVLKVKFERTGFQVQVAYDGADGYAKALIFKPHGIILDVRMPREDGLTFLRKLRAYRDDDPELQSRLRNTPVIVLTAASPHMKSLFQTEGISEYMEKPFDFEVLKARLLQITSPAKS
jgi:DNA-binding response OmpR family regulator